MKINNTLRHITFLIASILLLVPQISTAGNSKKVFLMKIDSEIDPRTNRYSELALDEATELGADLIILELDTYGGAVTDADEIRTRLLNYKKPIYVFINKDAASAGALISIACDSIYMAPGASIGAATVVVSTGEAAPDKYQSYMRSMMRSTAEANKRNPKIAEAMVDQNLEVDSVSKAGEVITFTTSEAIKYGFCEAEVNSIEEILKINHIDNFELVNYELSLSEKIIRIFLNPFISGILILVIIGGIYFELQTPGVGFPILAAIIAAMLYFVPYYLNGLAENWEIILFFVGIILLALEIFVIPGFGIAGVSGIVMIIISLILVMLNNDFFDFSFVDGKEITVAVSATLLAMIASIFLMFFGGMRLANSKFFKKIALVNTQDSKEGYSASFRDSSYVGKTGRSYTVLRPSGKILIDGELLDASTRGEFIDKDKEVIVLDDNGAYLKVKASEA